jgi:hypothetical protein
LPIARIDFMRKVSDLQKRVFRKVLPHYFTTPALTGSLFVTKKGCLLRPLSTNYPK